ncbi:MAG TPA: hypothetical protein VFQ42_04170 [Mycobacterium sp.]|nr:hypothetical protein [Mycobacterium sp.]
MMAAQPPPGGDVTRPGDPAVARAPHGEHQLATRRQGPRLLAALAWLHGHALELAAIAATAALASLASPWFAVLASLVAAETIRHEIRDRRRQRVTRTPTPPPARRADTDQSDEASA